MTLNKIFIFALSFCWLPTIAGNLSGRLDNDEMMVRQVPGSEDIVKEYFAGDTGIIYTMIYPLANCKRCEGTINANFFLLKKKTANPIILISAYDDKKAAERYVEQNGYKADRYIYDDDERFYDFLSFNTGILTIGYILKIDLDSGKLMAGFNDNSATDEFIDELAAYDGYMPQLRYENNEAMLMEESETFDFKNELKPTKSIPFNMPDSLRISNIYMQPQLDGPHLAINDKLWSEVYLLKLDDGENEFRLKSIIKSSPEENRRFVKIPNELYQHELDSKTVYFMPLSPMFVEDGKIMVSYSLPNLFVTKEVDGEVLGIGYKNKACWVVRDTVGNAYPLVYVDMEDDSEYFNKHFYFWKTGDKLIIPCQKTTWPFSGIKEEYAGKAKLDPFMADFYKQKNPYFSVYDINTGKLVSRFGNLGEIHEKSRTSYWFSSPVITGNDRGMLAYGSSYSGKIVLANVDSPDSAIAEYAVFDLDADSIPQPDPKMFYDRGCVAPYIKCFYRKVFDMKLSDDALHCIVRYGNDDSFHKNDYSYVRIDLRTKEREEAKLTSNGRMDAVGLWKKQDGSVEPYVISKQQGNYSVELFD